MDLNTLIQSEYNKLNTFKEDYQKLQIINNIIEFKKQSNNPNVYSSIYSDCRNYIRLAVTSIDSPGHGYFNLRQEKVLGILDNLTLAQQISILEYLARLLKLQGLEDEFVWQKMLLKRRKILSYTESKSITDKLRLIRDCATFNLLTVVSCLLILFIIYSVVLLPANNPNNICFTSEFKQYSSNKLINHVSNTLLGFTSVDNDEGIKIHATNVRGVLMTLLLKGIILLLVLKFLFDELKEKLKF